MSKVKLGDVAIEHKETCGGSKDGYPIVGLEHLTPEEVTLTAWDENSDNTFTKVFRKGNVLLADAEHTSGKLPLRRSMVYAQETSQLLKPFRIAFFLNSFHSSFRTMACLALLLASLPVPSLPVLSGSI